jgi:hypothetical protein
MLPKAWLTIHPELSARNPGVASRLGLHHEVGRMIGETISHFGYWGKDVDVQKVGNDLSVLALVTGRLMPRGDSGAPG